MGQLVINPWTDCVLYYFRNQFGKIWCHPRTGWFKALRVLWWFLCANHRIIPSCKCVWSEKLNKYNGNGNRVDHASYLPIRSARRRVSFSLLIIMPRRFVIVQVYSTLLIDTQTNNPHPEVELSCSLTISHSFCVCGTVSFTSVPLYW